MIRDILLRRRSLHSSIAAAAATVDLPSQNDKTCLSLVCPFISVVSQSIATEISLLTWCLFSHRSLERSDSTEFCTSKLIGFPSVGCAGLSVPYKINRQSLIWAGEERW